MTVQEDAARDAAARAAESTEPVAEATAPPVDGGGAGLPAIPASPRKRRRGWGSIQSKLLIMLLLTSLLSSSIVGFFAWRTGTNALREQAFESLTDVRRERTTALQSYFAGVRTSAVINSRGLAIGAMQEFAAAYVALADAPISDEQRSALDAYYADSFVPELEKNSIGTVQPDSFVPTSPARSYVQYHYTISSPDFDEKLALDDAGDGSAWSAANAKYQPFFRELVLRSGADDAMLIDLEGRLVWTAYKGVDLGSNVLTGEYQGGGLEAAYLEALRSNSVDFVAISDAERYQPSFNQPALFVASPIFDAQNETIGVYVVQVGNERISGIMTGSSDPDEVRGLGRTGETILAGPDALMRSDARLLLQDPDEYVRRIEANGTPDDVAELQREAGSSVVLQELPSARTVGVNRNTEGTVETRDYLGDEVFVSFAPAELEGLDWTVIAKISSDEALEPVSDFARTVLLALAAIALIVCAASVLISRIFTGPLDRLLRGVRAVAGGDLGVQIDAGSHDEFGDLGTAFNDMSTSLLTKQRLLDEQQAENDRMLGSMMPESVARRYRGGETDIMAEHRDVSVIYLEVEGFDDLAASRQGPESLTMLKALARTFEEAGSRTGVEKVRSIGTGYVASSGLVTQHVDHARRVVDFAVDVARQVALFNSQYGSNLLVRGGAHSGSVKSGLVGANDVVYNLWGDAVDLAYRVRTIAGEPGIYVTDSVRERLGTAYSFQPAGEVRQGERRTPVWRLDLPS